MSRTYDNTEDGRMARARDLNRLSVRLARASKRKSAAAGRGDMKHVNRHARHMDAIFAEISAMTNETEPNGGAE